MQGDAEPSADLLIGNIVRSIQTLPAQHRKRFDLDVIDDLGDVVTGIIEGAAKVTGETVGTVFHALGFRPHGSHGSLSSHHVTTPKGPAGNSAAQGGYSPIKADANDNNTLTKAIEAKFKDSTGLDIEANDLGCERQFSFSFLDVKLTYATRFSRHCRDECRHTTKIFQAPCRFGERRFVDRRRRLQECCRIMRPSLLPRTEIELLLCQHWEGLVHLVRLWKYRRQYRYG